MTGSLRPRIVVLQGASTLLSREIPPGDVWRLGRHTDSPLPLQERSISRSHVRIFSDAQGVQLEDLGSANGTFVDGRRIEGIVLLRDGNLIRLGQSMSSRPIMLRFEDPAARLLEAMAEPPRASVDTAELDVVSQAGPSAGAPPLPLAPGGSEAAAAPAPAPDPESAASAAGPAEGRAPLSRKRLAAGALVLGLVVWAAVALRVTQRPWQSVRVEPVRTQAGGHVVLRGTEVQPSAALKIYVGDQEAPIEELVPGQARFAVPVLAPGAAGLHPVPLRVERKGIVLLRQTLQYEARPEVSRLEPAEASVGDSVTIRGRGFSQDAALVKLRVGQQPALVLGATPTEIRFRVPVVTRSVAVELPVAVQIGEWLAPPSGLTVHPRDAPCYPMELTSRYLDDGLWEVRHPLGPALFLEGPAPPAPNAPHPPAIEKALAALGDAFQKAPADPSVRFEVREAGRTPVLVALGLRADAVEVGRFSPGVAARVATRAPEVRQRELIPYWGAVVLNELLDVFAKRQPPHLLGPADPLAVVLKRLHDLNLETGGQGCPSAAEVSTLKREERDVFENAATHPPPRFGVVGGSWEGNLDNVFGSEASDTTLELRLELKQTGTSLEGRMLVYEVRGPGIRWSPPPVEGLSGRVRLGDQTRIELEAPGRPPYYITGLAGMLADDTLEGSFHTLRKAQGRFQLTLKPGP